MRASFSRSRSSTPRRLASASSRFLSLQNLPERVDPLLGAARLIAKAGDDVLDLVVQRPAGQRDLLLLGHQERVVLTVGRLQIGELRLEQADLGAQLAHRFRIRDLGDGERIVALQGGFDRLDLRAERDAVQFGSGKLGLGFGDLLLDQPRAAALQKAGIAPEVLDRLVGRRRLLAERRRLLDHPLHRFVADRHLLFAFQIDIGVGEGVRAGGGALRLRVAERHLDEARAAESRDVGAA